MNDRRNPFEIKWIVPSIIMVVSMWFVFWLEMRLHTDFTKFGLFPRTWSGLRGIMTSPFIHSGFSHLWSNTVPIAVLVFFLSLFYNKQSIRILLYGLLLSGIFTWLIGRNSYHIGASGLIYMLASFIFFKGIFLNKYRQIAASLIIVFLYGSLIWYVLPIEPSISWEGHTSGAIAGLILAAVIKVTIPQEQHIANKEIQPNPEEEWFLQQFDEDGNFRPIQIEEDSDSENLEEDLL